MLFDELTSAFGAESVGEVLKVRQTLAEEGRKMLVANHVMGFAKNSSHSHVMFLHQSRVEEQEHPSELFANSRSVLLQQWTRVSNDVGRHCAQALVECCDQLCCVVVNEGLAPLVQYNSAILARPWSVGDCRWVTASLTRRASMPRIA